MDLAQSLHPDAPGRDGRCRRLVAYALRDLGWIEGQTLQLSFHFGARAGEATRLSRQVPRGDEKSS